MKSDLFNRLLDRGYADVLAGVLGEDVASLRAIAARRKENDEQELSSWLRERNTIRKELDDDD